MSSLTFHNCALAIIKLYIACPTHEKYILLGSCSLKNLALKLPYLELPLNYINLKYLWNDNFYKNTRTKEQNKTKKPTN